MRPHRTVTKLVLASYLTPLLYLCFSLLSPAPVAAATFQMQTGNYVGDGVDNRQITNIGFQPNLVLIKDDTTAGNEGILWRSSAMTGEVSAKLGEAEADIGSNAIQSFQSTGFTIGTSTDVNSAGIMYYWIAFAGSDCTSTGTFCVGTYTGNTTTQNITTGFQADMVVVKQSGTALPVWKSSSMTGTNTNYFSATTQDTGGQMIQSLNATTFTVGNSATVNAATTYWFFAFKQVSGAMDVGTYSGNASDGRNIDSAVDAGLTFKPNFAFTKNVNAATPVTAVFNISENYGDRSFLPTDAASAANHIQELRTAGGFQVGTSSNSNGSGNTCYYAAFGGASTHSASGTFTIKNGTYTGTSSGFSITGVGFAPDLVMIKHNDQATDQYAVWRSRVMKGNLTQYFANIVGGTSGMITALDSDGFTIGTSTTVNTAGDTYYWTAFGNAWNPDTNSGAADFAIGAYLGDGVDGHNIDRLPFQPDLVAVKREGATEGAWRTSNMSGDLSLFFSTTAQAANWIQQFNSDGFQRGGNAGVNTSGNTYWYFMFKNGTNFTVNNYTGNGTTQDVTAPGFQPDLIWTKKSTGGTARAGVMRTSAQTGDAAQPFLNTPTLTGGVTEILATGFKVGAANETNENTFVYRYAAWRLPNVPVLTVDIVDAGGASVASPSAAFSTISSTFQCQTTTATLGVSAQKIRVKNTTASPAWTVSIAATSGATAAWDSTVDYDFNDSGGSPAGCVDSGDADSLAGQMSFDFGSATITPQSGCTNTGVSLGSNASFVQGTTDSITVIQGSGSAQMGCYWDLIGIGLSQKVPPGQLAGAYSINMTLSVIAN